MSGSVTNERRFLQHYNQKQNFMGKEFMLTVTDAHTPDKQPMTVSKINCSECIWNEHHGLLLSSFKKRAFRCCLKENDTSKMERKNDREVYVRRGSSDAEELIQSTTGHCGQPCIERGCAFQSKYLNC
ncbi:hypothetical protein T4B_8259 [Trichinella pseudospiralis]|uniref:Uncharacterized protein n=1 Tax=Trichinella pseudospiralis TaxID=6337 RepID=A0A0V1H544_TRIPS|nr:hypothetical protein T4B_8259 [Trichinella pseudospiralis]